MVDILWLTVGIFATTLFFILAIVIVWLMMMIHNQQFNRQIRITNKTAGKDLAELYRAKLINHKTLGEVYYIPALKKEKRHYVPYYGKQYEYPTNKNKLSYVPLSYYNGTYAPEGYAHTEEEKQEVIRLFINGVNEKEFHLLPENDKRRDKPHKLEYRKVEETIEKNIIKPTKYSMRHFNLEMDTAIKDDFFLMPGFWDRYGGYILSFGLAMSGAIVAIIMIVFAYQWGVDVSQNAPEWMRGFMEQVANNGLAAPPTQG